MSAASEAYRTEAARGGAPLRCADVYDALRAPVSERAAADLFTAHVFACLLALAICEAHDFAESVGAALGLGRDDLRQLIDDWAPGAAEFIDPASAPARVDFDEEEAQLRALLDAHAVDRTNETQWLAAIVTRRSMAPRHLWQDLGLGHRGELTRLIGERFPLLAARNAANMKWKKFFYRSLCEMEGFTLCAAPSCQQCGDFADCFGDESGESALARVRNGS